MYYDEDLVLDIRLNTLNNYVDKFVIAEGTIDHAGNNKKLNFDFKKFSKFKNKIEYLIIDNIPIEVKHFKKNWHPAHFRDQFQRNSLKLGYAKYDDNDLIMISDLDEIPNPEKIKNFKNTDKLGCFIQKNYCMKFNILNISEPDWFGTRICKKKYLKSPQWLRDIKIKKRPFYKFYKPKFDKFIVDGGWHFSSVKSSKDIQKKINSTAEQQFNLDKFKKLSVIDDKINNFKDLFDRDLKFKPVKFDESFPEYMLENIVEFKKFIH